MLHLSLFFLKKITSASSFGKIFRMIYNNNNNNIYLKSNIQKSSIDYK